jgi:tripartite-type tricarboxylate transporter receptor subunit TctC
VADTVGGQTQVVMNGMLATLPFVQSGKLKVLGVSKCTRMPLIGDVPTLAEQGITNFARNRLCRAAALPPSGGRAEGPSGGVFF